MTDQYIPTPGEEAMARAIDSVVDAMLNGRLQGVGFCAVSTEGKPAFFYINKPEEPVLKGALVKLSALYELQQVMKLKTTAPPNNRSYQEH